MYRSRWHARRSFLAPLSMVIIALLLFSLACSTSEAVDSTATSNRSADKATSEPTDTVAKKTVAKTKTPTDEPLPTDTPDEEGTLAAEATDAAGSVVADIESVLGDAGIQPGSGRVVYAKKDGTTVSTSGYNTAMYQMIPGTGEVADFAMHSNVTWSSELGFSGCGWYYRIDKGGLDRGKYYEFYFNRLSGAPYYLINAFSYGAFLRRVGDGFSNLIDFNQDATNEVLFVAKKTEFQIFFNGQKVKTLYDGTSGKGEFAFYSWTESSTAQCVFEDTWIWTWDA